MEGNVFQQSDAALQLVKNRTAPPGTSAELVKYLLVELDVAREDHAAFCEKMTDLVALMFDHRRWELVFASYPIGGVLNRFVHIWQIPDESDVLEVMREGAVDRGTLPPAEPGTIAEAFRECYKDVQSLVQRTTHTLMTSLPYDPTHVGFQSQTILIDAEGELFLIDHHDLRKAEDVNRSKLLEKVRRAKFTRRLRSNAPLPSHQDAGSVEGGLIDMLVEVQIHLNRGTPVARLTTCRNKALLFNLAGLKAKSVFQPVKPPVQAAGPNLGKVSQANGEADLPVERILLAMPWGGVYDLDSERLEGLARPLTGQQKNDTEAAVEPIVQGLAPLAAIPEERDDVVGDGCACFVINLRSFVSTALPPKKKPSP